MSEQLTPDTNIDAQSEAAASQEFARPVTEQRENILEVYDLKKYFLTKKEWKMKKFVVSAVPAEKAASAADDGNARAATSENTDSAQSAPSEAAAESTIAEGEQPVMKPKFKTQLVLDKTFVKAVNGVTFNVKYGETLGIVGESGCGKSTMGRSILRLHDISGGRIVFDGTDITKLKAREMRKLRTQMQIIFQDPYSSLPPRSPVGAIIGEAVKVHKIVPKSEYRSYVMEIMRKCGLQDFYFDRYPHEFSGGQRQRICIARALAVKPKFIVCDEPVSALDVSIQAQIINLLKELQRDLKLTYLFISHDLSVVQHISDRVGVMYLGNFVELGNKNDIFGNPMHPYTHALLSAVPVPDPHNKGNRIILQGDIPSPAHPPKGCKFHTRCTKCMEVCKEVEPKFIDYGNGHMCACHLYPQE